MNKDENFGMKALFRCTSSFRRFVVECNHLRTLLVTFVMAVMFRLFLCIKRCAGMSPVVSSNIGTFRHYFWEEQGGSKGVEILRGA